MKKQLISVLAVCALSVVLAAPLFADSAFEVNIPVEFIVANHTLPAGQYIFEPIQGGALAIRAVGGPTLAMAITRSVQGSQSDPKAAVILHRYGDTYFLYRAWNPTGNVGYQVSMSPRERELAKGKSQAPVESVVAQKQ